MLKSTRIAALMKKYDAMNCQVLVERSAAFARISSMGPGNMFCLDMELARRFPDALKTYDAMGQAHRTLVYAMRDLQRKSITNAALDQIEKRVEEYAVPFIKS